MGETPGLKPSRRDFLRSSASAALGGALASQLAAPAVVSARPNSETLRIGLVGCGGRGSGAAVNALNADPNVELTAMADLFDNELQASLKQLQKQVPEKVKVTPERCFLGFDAYQKLMAGDVDVVILATPPGFRPEHLRAAVEAGKHSFVEITIAVDAPGVRSALESSEIAAKKNLAIVSGFCWRYNSAMRAAAEQIRAGTIGEVRSLYATYLRGDLGHKYHNPRPEGISDLEWQLRDWYGHLWLSGDVTILLSGGHSVDKMSWWLGDEMPRSAVATGSQVFPTGGNTFDNCFVAYEYANGIYGFLACRSQAGCFSENADRIVGSKGICTIAGTRGPVITGENPWRYDGPQNNMYQTEHDELIASIRSGKPINDGARMAKTTLMALMGRMAAYTGQQITWEQALGSQDRVVPEKLDWNMKLEPRPLAVPGLTKFA
ncbi:MAG: Gfo/Idh/MocA family oxidoreductase [Pirellulales bacterium]|nr:Gfo/Idh/MocA family oxidoreductase [Pirellulales bacterium]